MSDLEIKDEEDRDSLVLDEEDRASLVLDDIALSQEESILPSPKLLRNTSNSITDQQQDPTCYAHVAARVLLRYFKVYIINPKNIPGNNETTEIKEVNSPCDDLYLDPLQFCNIKQKGKCIAKDMNLLEKCGGNEYEHLCLILYMFFYSIIVEKIGCFFFTKDLRGNVVGSGGGYLVAALTHVVDVIYNYDSITNIQQHCFMAVSDCEKIRELLAENYRNNDMGIINFGIIQTFHEIIGLSEQYVTDEHLYLGITIDGEICNFKEHHPELLVPQEIIKSTSQPHIVTLIDYIKDTETMFIKNSWGKSKKSKGLLRFHTSEIKQFVKCYVGGVSHEPRESGQNQTGTIYSLCIRNDVAKIDALFADLLEYRRDEVDTYDEYYEDNETYIQQSFVFVINAGKNEMFEKLLMVFDNTRMLNEPTVFNYLIKSSACQVDPGNMINLIKIMFEFCSLDENDAKLSLVVFNSFLAALKIYYNRPALIKYISPFERMFNEYKKKVVNPDDLEPDDLSFDTQIHIMWNKYRERDRLDPYEHRSELTHDYNNYFHTNISMYDFDSLSGKFMNEDEGWITEENFIKMFMYAKTQLEREKAGQPATIDSLWDKYSIGQTLINPYDRRMDFIDIYKDYFKTPITRSNYENWVEPYLNDSGYITKENYVRMMTEEEQEPRFRGGSSFKRRRRTTKRTLKKNRKRTLKHSKITRKRKTKKMHKHI
jgi:hypothetical protein